MKNAIRPVIIKGDVAIVPLTRGYEAIIDAEDAIEIGKYNWAVAIRGKKIYAARSVWAAQSTEMMHRRLMKEPKRLVDHIDGDGLNNRKLNLRKATRSQNAMNGEMHVDNKSGFKGVSYHKARGKWVAWIMREGNRKYLGLFGNPESAHAAYVEAAKEHHGKFARFK